jgi:hypothetical protein
MGHPLIFSLASNVIDFGIRAYLIEKNSVGTGNLNKFSQMLILQLVEEAHLTYLPLLVIRIIEPLENLTDYTLFLK